MTSNNHFHRDAIGAVVIGGDYQGLGIVRSLGQHDIPVGIIDDEASIAQYSRYATFSERVSSLRDPERLVSYLMDVGKKRQLKGWVLYPTRDETVAALCQHREDLGKYFRVTAPSWDSVKCLWDKRNTYSMAAKLAIPFPRTWYARDQKDLDQIEGHFPVALKPAIKEHFFYETRDKAWRADNLPQLRSLFDRASQFMPRDEIMIQDLVPGNGDCQYAYCSFFKQGQSVASLVVCRRRQHPLEFGRASTYVESVALPILEELSERFLRATNFYGLVELEYKCDPRDGQFRLLDVNGRTWGYHTIGRRAGVDFPHLLFTDQLNKPIEAIEPIRGHVGVRWIRLLTDVPTGVVGILKGKVDWRAYLRSLRDFDEEAVFSEDDPMPGLAEVALLPYLSFKRGF